MKQFGWMRFGAGWGPLWLWCLSLVGMGGCAGPGKPVLRVATSGDYAPFSEGGRGFDIEVIQRFAEDGGYQVQWVPFTWPTLTEVVAQGQCDLAVGGITWRPDRALVGSMSRALVTDGPCELRRVAGATGPVGVNRGGILERWARRRYPAASIVAVDDNQSLPDRLRGGEVAVVVTDSLEAPHFREPGWDLQCEPARDRKVYWVAPGRVRTLGPALDSWLAAHEAELQRLRRTWFERAFRWSDTMHLLDLLSRRLAMMPEVAACKRAVQAPLTVPERETEVLNHVQEGAVSLGLAPEPVRALFALQIRLAKAVQRRSAPVPCAHDLDGALRPKLIHLGQRILESLAQGAATQEQPSPEAVALLFPMLTRGEQQALIQVLERLSPRVH